jgi:sortase (surface protein transpeptidase)
MARQVLGGVSGAVLGAALLGSAHGAGLGAGAERGVSADGLAAGAAAATRVAGAAGGSADAVGAARVAGMTGAAESPAATAASGVAAPPVAAKAPGPKAAGGGSAAASAAPGGPLRPLPASTPVSLAIPAIGVRAPMMALGLDGAGALETPPFDMPGTAAWFRDSPAPGAVGASVVVGHVDTRSGPAVFWKLAALRTGSTVEVARLDGRVAVFTVQRVRMYPKDRFPAKEVYSASGPADRSELRLITCGGPFDRKRAEYTGNVVAYARLTAVR